VRQAQSKQKIIDRMEEAGLVEKVEAAPLFNFKFASCEKLPPPVLSIEHVAFSYSGEVKDYLYKDLNLGVDSDSRIALVGPNGAGKSTLLKLMMGDVKATEGQIRTHLHAQIARYNQHSNDQLDPTQNVLDFVRNSFKEIKEEEQWWRQTVGRFGISGTVQKSLVGSLSDGMKSRVVFCMLAIAKPNLLLLDEPTNHLDMECIDSLARAINEFEGGVVLVSHDFRLLSQVAKQIWVCDKSTVSPWNGDITSYKKSLVEKMKRQEREDAKAVAAMSSK
jgi:ATP-binding cassette subfamily F protein 2